MISAAEALALPGARLTPSDAEAAERLLADVEVYVRKNMLRTGCLVPIDFGRVNPSIASEVERACREKGWQVTWQQEAMTSKLAPGQKLIELKLVLLPSHEAYTESVKYLRETDN